MSWLEIRNKLEPIFMDLYKTPTRVMSFEEARLWQACRESQDQHLRARAHSDRLHQLGLK